MSTVFGLKLIYNQIKRLFTGIKFLFIRIRYVLESRQQVDLCDELQARDFVFYFNDNFNVNNFAEGLFS